MGSRVEEKSNGSRLKEMTAVLKKHKIMQGLTPEKLRLILEDLGPTYIKLGQIMSLHSDILPKQYCDELMKLCSDVAPMQFSQVEEVLHDSFGVSWKEVFSSLDPEPLGAASIAQVHRAVLQSGEQVVVKVQRKGIYEIMSRDIALLHKAYRLIPPVSIKELVNLDMVLDEMWAVAQEEMNFLTEAANMEEFARYNKEVAFVATPVLHREYTTTHVLVMEYIDGFQVDNKQALVENGYDLNEIGSKLVDNYIRQVMEDGFFHADPHPGNIRIRDGKIVWIDMGMMGRLTERDRKELTKAIQGIAAGDVGMIQDAVLALGDFRAEPDTAKLYKDIEKMLEKYGSLDMGEIDVAVLMQEMMEIMKVNRISMPHGLSMLARGLTQMEGVLTDISPQINMVEIATARMKAHLWQNFDWKKELKNSGKDVFQAVNKTMELPTQLSKMLEEFKRGQMRINLDMHASRELSRLLHRLVRNIVMGLWVMALLISSSIICTTDMSPKLLGIPALGAIGYMFACIIVLYTLIKHFVSKR